MNKNEARISRNRGPAKAGGRPHQGGKAKDDSRVVQRVMNGLRRCGGANAPPVVHDGVNPYIRDEATGRLIDTRCLPPINAEVKFGKPVDFVPKPKPAGKVAKFSHLVNNRPISLPSPNKDVVEELLAKGYTHIKVSESNVPNQHPRSAAYRALAVRHMLADGNDGAHKMRVLSVYGAKCDQNFVQSFNDFCVNNKYGSITDDVFEPHFIDLVSGIDYDFGGDAARLPMGSFPLADMAPATFDVVFLMDIYQSGCSWKEGLTVSALKRYCSFSKTGRIKLCTRMFFGQAGVDDVPPNKPLEGRWWRQLDGFVCFTPEEMGQPYAPHPTNEHLLMQRSIEGLAINLDKTFGPYWVFTIALEAETAQTIGAVQVPVGEIEYVSLSEDRLLDPLMKKLGLVDWVRKHHSFFSQDFIGHVEAVEKVLVHNQVYSQLCGSNMAALTSFKYTDVRHQVNGALMEHRVYRMLSRHNPEMARAVLFGTHAAVMFANRRALTRVAAARFERDFESNERISEALKHRRANSLPKTILIGTACGVATIGLGVGAVLAGPHIAALATTKLAAGAIIDHAADTVAGKWFNKVAERVAVGMASCTALGSARLGYAKYKTWRRTRKESVPDAVFQDYADLLVDGGDVEQYLHTIFNMEPSLLYLPPGTTLPRVANPPPKTAEHLPVDLVITHESVIISPTSLPPLRDPMENAYSFSIHQPGLAAPHGDVCTVYNSLVKRICIKHDMPKNIQQTFDNLYELWKANFPARITRELTYQECAATMAGPAARRLLENGAAMEHMGWSLGDETRKTAFLKLNEVIKVGSSGIKARVLDNFKGAHSVKSLAFAHELLGCMKGVFNGLEYVKLSKPGSFRTMDFRIAIASGSTPEEMDGFGRLIDGATPFVLVSGDDLAIYWNDLAWIRGCAASEGDQTTFDITQGRVCISNTCRIFEYCGVPKEICDMFLLACCRPIKVRTKTGHRLIARPECRASTGSGFTTCMNTVASIMFVFQLFTELANGNDQISFEEVGRQLGFVTKQIDHATAEQCIFLKGAFLPSVPSKREGDYYRTFTNLPSLCLKMGKHLVDPRISQSTSDPVLALALAAGAMGRSLPQYPVDFPVLGAFLAALRRVGVTGGACEVRPYKVYGSAKIEREVVIDFMIHRYQTTIDEIHSLEEMYNKVVSIPCWLVHPLLCKMTLKDYY